MRGRNGLVGLVLATSALAGDKNVGKKPTPTKAYVCDNGVVFLQEGESWVAYNSEGFREMSYPSLPHKLAPGKHIEHFVFGKKVQRDALEARFPVFTFEDILKLAYGTRLDRNTQVQTMDDFIIGLECITNRGMLRRTSLNGIELFLNLQDRKGLREFEGKYFFENKHILGNDPRRLAVAKLNRYVSQRRSEFRKKKTDGLNYWRASSCFFPKEEAQIIFRLEDVLRNQLEKNANYFPNNGEFLEGIVGLPNTAEKMGARKRSHADSVLHRSSTKGVSLVVDFLSMLNPSDTERLRLVTKLAEEYDRGIRFGFSNRYLNINFRTKLNSPGKLHYTIKIYDD